MALWPFQFGPASWVDVSITSGWLATSAVVASSSTHTMGAWTELVVATSEEWAGFHLFHGATTTSATDTSTLLEVGIGASGQEKVLLPAFNAGYATSSGAANSGRTYWIPLRVPAGERVAARVQSAVSSKSVTVGVAGFSSQDRASGAPPVYAKATVYGADAAASKGTNFTPGAGALGAWVEVTAATTARTDAVIVVPSGAANAARGANNNVHGRIAVGAAGSEVALSTLGFECRAGTDEAVYMKSGPHLIRTAAIPEGSRLAVAGWADASSSALDATVIAFTL